ncbi:hypothetical protein HU200_056452 [Digitaria exilis]|uniref:Late embryogenesis abundant protein LEA-2 subgroup domain-containing protein n=1 Tax=Digitaria exilis TaxID=1010633 RepID=A0A835AJ51_9POAL|nr:hypothetical protein HU200_056452 [Digitaria exilis]
MVIELKVADRALCVLVREHVVQTEDDDDLVVPAGRRQASIVMAMAEDAGGPPAGNALPLHYRSTIRRFLIPPVFVSGTGQQPNPGPTMALTAKHYTVAALMATLAVAVVVTVVFVVLCPARVTFSLARTSHEDAPTGGLRLNLTLAIDNPSRRAAVAYESMFVDLSNSTAVVQGDNWIRATVTTPMPLRQARGSPATVDAAVDLVAGPWTVTFTGNMTSSFSVIVTAQARFKVGVAWTRLYDIKVSCRPVSFFQAAKAKLDAAAASLPVKCV